MVTAVFAFSPLLPPPPRKKQSASYTHTHTNDRWKFWSGKKTISIFWWQKKTENEKWTEKLIFFRSFFSVCVCVVIIIIIEFEVDWCVVSFIFIFFCWWYICTFVKKNNYIVSLLYFIFFDKPKIFFPLHTLQSFAER